MASIPIVLVKPALLAAALAVLPAVPDAAAAQEDGFVHYRIQQGDTLIGLSNRFFTSDRAVSEVARINGIRNPRRIPVGTVIRIPRNVLRTRSDHLRVYEVTGPVTINGQRPSRNDWVRADALIQTQAGGFISFEVPGSRGTIALPSNTRVRLESANIYEFGGLRDIDFTVLNGRGSMSVPGLEEGERFNSRTPVAVTAVRGTEYRISYSEASGIGTSEVVEGIVSVDAEETEVRPEAGFGLAASAEGLGDIEALLPAPEIVDPNATQTGEDVVFTVSPPDGAVGTRVQLARDPRFLEMVADQVTIDGTARFADLDNARYFVRARGLADSGVEGLEGEVDASFRRKRLGASAEVSPLAYGYRFVWQAEGEGNSHVAFQLWREGDADAPLYDEIALPGTAAVVTDLEPGTYQWRVGVLQADPEEETGFLKIWADEGTFTVAPE